MAGIFNICVCVILIGATAIIGLGILTVIITMIKKIIDQF